ncbi:MAG: glycoside hydrolase family 5 protein [Cytophagaceae bacterium]
MFKKVLSSLALILSCLCSYSQNSVVEKYGQLSVNGNYIISQYGDTVQLRGMSLFWSQWMPQYYTGSTIKWLKEDWQCTVVRAAMGVEMGGYWANPEEERQKVTNVVNAAIRAGIYVIIDYHSHEAHTDPESAKRFFGDMAKKYGKYQNVLYEIFNEPLQNTSWSKEIKPYSEEVIKAIRAHDPDNIIICGTRQWSQLVYEASKDPIKDTNIAYTLHYYAATHKNWLREEAKKAMGNGIALFVTEFGTTEASGNGKIDYEESKAWFDFLDQYKISWCNWSVCDKDETSAALKPGTSGFGKWREDEITPSGKFIREELKKKNPVFKKK